jgi:hypothetical protein
MSLVLQSSGGGQITIQEPATASNFTQTLPAASGEVMVSGNMPAFSYGQSVSQNLTTGTATKITFTSSDFDTTSGMFASSRFTPTVAGYYQISSAIQTATGATASNSNYIYIYKNGSVFKQSSSMSAVGIQQAGTISGLVYCNGSTDYIEIYMLQQSVAISVTFADTTRTYFQASMVRAA